MVHTGYIRPRDGETAFGSHVVSNAVRRDPGDHHFLAGRGSIQSDLLGKQRELGRSLRTGRHKTNQRENVRPRLVTHPMFLYSGLPDLWPDILIDTGGDS